MKRTATFFSIAIIILGITVPLPARATDAPAAAAGGQPVIHEFQTGGCANGELGGAGQLTACGPEDGTREFVELYNPSGNDADITGWQLEYLSASHSGTDAPTRVIATLSGKISSQGFVLLSYAGYLAPADAYFGADSTATGGLFAKSGGHVRLTDAQGSTMDLVSWGSAKQIAGWQRLPVLSPGYSAQRMPSDAPGYTAATPFAAPAIPISPMTGGLIIPMPPEPDPADQPPHSDSPSQMPEAGSATNCDNAALSEILPNPAGADGGQEFIELHNPTEAAISLAGCHLRLGDAGKTFQLPNVLVEPFGYAAFYDSETKLVLPNASGTTVWLIGSAEAAVPYPNSLDDDRSWALIENTWQEAQATPEGANTPIAIEVPASATDTPTAATASTPCKAGQERNPQTNRCRAIASVANTQPTVCKANQQRNPETGRCRAIATAAAQTACKTGQEKNPETNRCRNIPATAVTKPCAAGQERNPETGRCRKSASTAQTNDTTIQEVKTAAATKVSWLVAGTAVAGAGGYGVYEWRRDIWGFLSGLRERLKG